MASRLGGKWFVPVDVKAPHEPRFLRLSHGAFRLWVHLLSYSSSHLTDGVIERAVLRAAWGLDDDPAPLLAELVREGLLVEHDLGFLIHGWENWHASRGEIESAREFHADRAKKGAAARWGGRASSDASKHASKHASNDAKRDAPLPDTYACMHKSNGSAKVIHSPSTGFPQSYPQNAPNDERVRFLEALGADGADAELGLRSTMRRLTGSSTEARKRGLDGRDLLRFVLAAVRRDLLKELG